MRSRFESWEIRDDLFSVIPVNDFCSTTSKLGACFVAGTLVHTKEDLRPIELLQVGDWVLSKDESGTGETAYKQVLRTHRFEEKEIWYLQFSWLGAISQRPKVYTGFLTCTRNHPFWIKGYREYRVETNEDCVVQYDDLPHDVWLKADLIEPGMILELVNGGLVVVTKSLYLAKTEDDHIGFIQGNGAPGAWQDELDGRLVVFGKNGPETDCLTWSPSLVYNRALEYLGDEFDFPIYQAAVYNIEVEDFYTYYVGEMGVWAHSA